MLIAMFLLLMRRLNRKYSVLSKLKGFKTNPLRTKIIFVALLFMGITKGRAQDQNLSFEVWKNNSHIGNISMTEKISSDSVVYDLSSKIKTKVMLSINITGMEKSIYKNGLLVYSSVYRKLNSIEKVNKELNFKEGKYQLRNSGRKLTLPVNQIKVNLVWLYFYEPIDISQVYCDNHHSMADIVVLENGKYKVLFPDGSFNIFYYQNGRCKKVEAFSSLYDVQIISSL